MAGQAKRGVPTHHGYGEVRVSRYFALYFAQLAWIALGLYLYSGAYWPSSCIPANLIEIYSCSPHLPENRGWREAALMTWLWSTPILIALEISRRVGRTQD